MICNIENALKKLTSSNSKIPKTKKINEMEKLKQDAM